MTVLATEPRSELGNRIVATVGRPAARGLLDHPYDSSGLRFQIATRSIDGTEMTLIDGGAFDWNARLTSNRRAVYVATGMGSQLVPLMFRRV